MRSVESENARVRRTFKRAKEILERLDKDFPTRAAKLREMRRLASNKDRCFRCNGPAFESKRDPRRYNCPRCKRSASYTTHTMFERVRCLRAWLAIAAFFDAGLHINAFQASQLLEIAPSTAQEIYKKIGLLILNVQEQQTDTIEVDIVQFRDAIGKASRLTPSHEKPANERRLNEDDPLLSIQAASLSTEENIRLAALNEIAKENETAIDIYNFIAERGQPNSHHVRNLAGHNPQKLWEAICDMLSNRVIMRVGQFRFALYERYFVDPTLPCTCVHKVGRGIRIRIRSCSYHARKLEVEEWKREESTKAPRKNESLEVAAKRLGLPWLATWAVNFEADASTDDDSETLDCKRMIQRKGLRFIHRLSKFHRKVSRKNAQIYLALVWWLTNRKFRDNDSLLALCANTEPTSPIDRRNYNSPEKVIFQLPDLARTAGAR